MSEVTLEILKEFVSALNKENIKYTIIAGFGLDGKRGFQTRPHQDLDVLCLKTDLVKIENIIKKLNYSGKRFNDLYKLNRKDGSKIDLGLLTIEFSEAVSYGRIAITRFPKILFEKPQKGKIENLEFNIAPNELLKIWGKDSKKGNDSHFSYSLEANEKLLKKIKRVFREDL
jgi:hypothetical protein